MCTFNNCIMDVKNELTDYTLYLILRFCLWVCVCLCVSQKPAVLYSIYRIRSPMQYHLIIFLLSTDNRLRGVHQF